MDASIRTRSITLSVLIHAAIVLILLLVAMKTPIPPFPESGGGSGVLVNIGYVESAAGAVQPMSSVTTPEPAIIKTQAANQPEESYATQDMEEAPVVQQQQEKKKTPVKADVKPVVTQKKPEPVKTVNTNALYKGKTTSSTSQGTANTGTGDQGAKDGDPLSQYYGKNGSGGGPGTGTGDGSGPGSGPGKGGISFDLGGRRMITAPSINDRSQETGKVVVSITVDKNGTVVAAIPGYRGSTTTSSYLFSKAKEAAMHTRFSPSPEGADIQKGTITFVFVVQ